MARPKKDEGTPARERLESAFWEMLREASLSEVTIAGISRRAQVNHNTFYRYFSSLEDLARRMLDQTLVPDLPAQILTGFASGAFIPKRALADEDMQDRLRRVCLLAGPHSPAWLIAELKGHVISLWLTSAGIDRDGLTDDERAQLSFIVGGVLSTVGEFGQDGDLFALSAIAEGELGRAIITVIADMAGKSRGSV